MAKFRAPGLSLEFWPRGVTESSTTAPSTNLRLAKFRIPGLSLEFWPRGVTESSTTAPSTNLRFLLSGRLQHESSGLRTTATKNENIAALHVRKFHVFSLGSGH